MRGLLRDIIFHDTQIALSGDVIAKATGKTPIVYDQLQKYNSLSDLLPGSPEDPNKDFQVILYVSARGQGSISGHYCIIMGRELQSSSPKFEFFDSYGLHMDEELNYVEHSEPYLSNLAMNSGLSLGDISYNPYRLQEMDDQQPSHTNVCGNYCILRLHLSDFSHEKFYKLLTENKKEFYPDVLVSMLTFLFYR